MEKFGVNVVSGAEGICGQRLRAVENHVIERLLDQSPFVLNGLEVPHAPKIK